MPSKKEKSGATSDEAVEKGELNQALDKLWLEIDGVVRSSPSGSMLRDMGRLEIDVKSHSVPSDEAERVIKSVGWMQKLHIFTSRGISVKTFSMMWLKAAISYWSSILSTNIT